MVKKVVRKALSSPRRKKARSARTRTSRKVVSASRLLRLGLSFEGARAFLSAVELGVFSLLAQGALDEKKLSEQLGLHPRAARDFLDTLVALEVLQRKAGKYGNAPDADIFLDRAKPTYVGGLLEMAAARLYPFWGSLTEALRTGAPQNEARQGGDPFAAIYATPEKLRHFLGAMTGVSLDSARAVAVKFPWKKYKSFVDVGGAQGCVPVQIASIHKHLSGAVYDLPPVGPVYTDYVRSFGLDNRLTFYAGDFFQDPLPKADVLIMGHILHDWDLQEKQMLLEKAFAALPRHGALIVYDAMIDDGRRRNLAGLLMSLNMLIETPGGFDYTPSDCRSWMKMAGFSATKVVPLTETETMVIATKQR